VVFEETGWTDNAFLVSKIKFKPPILDALAKEAGIDVGVLALLKKLGVTSEAELKDRLGIKEEPTSAADGALHNVGDALKDLLGDAPQPTSAVPDPAAAEPAASAQSSGGAGSGTGQGQGSGTLKSERGGKSGGQGAGQTATSGNGTSVGRASFISYLGTHPNDEEPDPDSLDHAARMALEEKATALICKREPMLRRTPTQNPGFDLFELSIDGQPVRWVEVKAMAGDLRDRPVGLSHTQFECAQKHGDAYWLYVVEHAGDEHSRIVRIQNPAGMAKTFTFDHGWLAVAEVDAEHSASEEEAGNGKNRDHED